MPVVHFGEYIMELEKNMKLVILIDADNASADIIEPLLEEIAIPTEIKNWYIST